MVSKGARLGVGVICCCVSLLSSDGSNVVGVIDGNILATVVGGVVKSSNDGSGVFPFDGRRDGWKLGETVGCMVLGLTDGSMLCVSVGAIDGKILVLGVADGRLVESDTSTEIVGSSICPLIRKVAELELLATSRSVPSSRRPYTWNSPTSTPSSLSPLSMTRVYSPQETSTYVETSTTSNPSSCCRCIVDDPSKIVFPSASSTNLHEGEVLDARKSLLLLLFLVSRKSTRNEIVSL
mmetsp:Transcript_58893/g.144042  ORF Transcript_58893/g.144042 Transcript_58893/m.144042 type:complete len:237 (+) Transcript_58893:708-1418(+)